MITFDYGKNAILTSIREYTGWGSHAFTNDIVPSDGTGWEAFSFAVFDTWNFDFDAPAGVSGGYMSNWTGPFPFTVYGYVVSAGPSAPIWGERFDTPVVIEGSGDIITRTLTIKIPNS